MSEETRALTAEERDRLQPLIEECEIPVRVSLEEMTLDGEGMIPLAGQAVGHWPFERRVILREECFETYSDLQLTGLLAHELGHHDGRHVLLARAGKFAICLLALASFGGLWGLALLSAGQAAWGAFVGCLLGFALVIAVVLLGSAWVSRRVELAADRRAAALLDNTEPLESLCRPGEDMDRGPRWAELLYPSPHPADRCAALRK